MSRCFPFPPPGYEKKTRTDEVELLKKEKHREKKHKKEKKDKEKRENKEKKEKEGRGGKDKEKKDKKEKHRDKKKEKDKHKDKGRDKDKGKISTADDKGFPGQAVDPNAGKLHQNEIKQSDKKGILFEEKHNKQYIGHNGEKARENNHLAEENKDSKFLLELNRRIKDNNGGAGYQSVQNFLNTYSHRKDEGTVKLVHKGSGTLPDGKEKYGDMDMDLDAKKIDGKGILADVRPIGNATVQTHAGNYHPKVDEMPRLVETNFNGTLEATVEGKGKVKEKKDERKEKKVKEKKDEGKDKVKERKNDKLRDKKKDKEKKKKGPGKDKDRDKEKRKEEKAKVDTELRNTDQNKLKESNRDGSMCLNSSTQVSKNSHENAVSAENIKKRKDIESNGVPRGNDHWPSKLPRLSPSHPFTENGRILERCQVFNSNASGSPGVVTSVEVDNKERKINGFVKAPPFAASSTKAQIATAPTVAATEAPARPPHPDAKFLSQLTEASAKPPHPDTKYLSQVYSVPKMDAWSEFDDQEWLLGSSGSEERKRVVKSSEVGDTRQVWAEALHIETADIYALPYVVPY
ncbi:hypothetical protein Lalb_Chr07g0186821 [Lupinus albus]|uniref:Myb-like protein X n=1 Tax=Lupinus albus TaxID=3870 RepID=A0A6A4Q933_LUPAL|nr:hypothetical protein Lalb_Chr07g0186821 [Lupinus albus]